MTLYRLREVLVYRHGSHRVVLMLQAYFDESGHSRDPREKVIAIAGAIAPLEKWECFEQEWDELLGTFRIEWYHATALKNFRDQFTGWTDYRRQQFTQPALSIMNRNIVQYVGAVLPLAEYEGLTNRQKAECPDPYFLCFQDTVHAAGIETEAYGAMEKVEAIFAENLEMGGKIKERIADPNEDEGLAYRCYRACKRDLPIRERLGPITFDSPRNLYPLQAADLVAFELLQVGRAMVRPEKIPTDQLRWEFQQILTKGPKFHYYVEGELSRRMDWAK